MRMWIVGLALGLPGLLGAQSQDDEIALALSAAPAAIAEHASVYVLTPSGFRKAREGSNGFSCLVLRDHLRTRPDAKGPVCYDREGTRVILPRVMAEARMQIAGKSEAEIRRAVREGLANGTYHAPARAGIAYMLSTRAMGVFPGSDTLVSVAPHVMIYAPYLRNADIGGVPPTLGKSVDTPFVLQEGEFNAYIIIPTARTGA